MGVLFGSTFCVVRFRCFGFWEKKTRCVSRFGVFEFRFLGKKRCFRWGEIPFKTPTRGKTQKTRWEANGSQGPSREAYVNCRLSVTWSTHVR